MKKCSSQLEFEAFLREHMEETPPIAADERKPAAAAFRFAERNNVGGGNQHANGNMNMKMPALSVTIQSQLSFCASPTSAYKHNGKENQVPGENSYSDESDSESIELEAGLCEQSGGGTDIKRLKRMVSNRESARRSRKRKQAQLADLESQVDQLRGENASLCKQLTAAHQQFDYAVTDNRILKSNVENLRVKVKWAEEAVTRAAISCGLDRIIHVENGSTPPSINPLPPACQVSVESVVLPDLDFQNDNACFITMSPGELIQNSLESLESEVSSGDGKVENWVWDGANMMSKLI